MNPKRILKVALFLGLVLSGVRALAQSDEMEVSSSAPDPEAVAKKLGLDINTNHPLTDDQIVLARTVGRDVVCLCGTCPKEPIADCTCGWAGANRRIIQAALAKGMTREQIVAAYRQTFGDKVLAMLPDEGLARMAWILPYAASVAGILAVFFVGMRFMRRSEEQAREEQAREEQATDEQARPGTRASKTGDEESRKALARELDELD